MTHAGIGQLVPALPGTGAAPGCAIRPGDGLCDRTLPAEGTDFCAILTKLRFPIDIPHVFQPGRGSENSLGQAGSAAIPECSGQLPRRDFRGSCPPEEGVDNPGALGEGAMP